MPIVKVPTVYKFGILSQSQHQDCQQKHLKKTLESPRAEIRKPPEVTEEFIKHFNTAEEPEEQERVLDVAEKLLHRCKRRSGYSSLGTGEYVDLPRAWTELILLAQCKGKIQEDAMDILLASLDHAPLEPEHSPVLFFLAESVLYRICCDAVQKPYLYSSEVKLSKIGFLTFLRLYCFHLSGQLPCHEEYKHRLHTYLQAIPACEDSYLPYPNVLSALHVMLKAGELICGAVVPWKTELADNERLGKEDCSRGMSCLSTNHSAHSEPEQKESEMNQILWHSLLVWFCVSNKSSHLDEVLQQLVECKEELLKENWLDSVLALFVLGEAAKLNGSCLKVLMELVSVFIPRTPSLQLQDENCLQDVSSWPWEVVYIYSLVLANICVNANTSELQKHALVGFQDEAKSTKHTDEVQDTSLCGLLRYCLPQTFNNADELFWIIRYGAVYNLVKVCSTLHGDVNREGLRNAAWKALYKHQSNEDDTRVLEAVKVAEAEINGPANPFISKSAKTPSTPCCSQHVGWRLTTALSQLFLPPIVPHIPQPKKHVPRLLPIKHSEAKQDCMEKKVAQFSLRREFMQSEPAPGPSSDYISRTDADLQRIIEKQWCRELQIQMKEEEDLLKKELLEKQEKEEERFMEIMKQRGEKLKKKTKPYEIPAAAHEGLHCSNP